MKEDEYDPETGWTIVDNNPLYIPASIEGRKVTIIGEESFKGILGNSNIVIPNGVEQIGLSAFEGMYNLTSVSLPNTLKVIGQTAFFDCMDLSVITLPDSLEEIGDNAFGYTNISSVWIPENVRKLNGSVFEKSTPEEFGSSNLIPVTVSVSSKNKFLDSRDNCNGIIETATGTLLWGNSKTVIPSGVKKIGEYAFSGAEFKQFVVPSNVTEIGRGAFSGCSYLEKIFMSDNVISIGDSAFTRCSSLTYISFSKNIKNLGEYAFSECSSLSEIRIAGGHMRKTLENCCLAVLSISMVVSLTGCKIIENKVADAKKDIEQLQDSTAITTTENSEKINTEKSETIESDKKDNISDTMATTEEISTVDDNSAKSSTNLESGGEKSQISEREWKDAYIEKIQSVKNEYSYVWGYLYDLDDNGIPELIISDWGSHDGESYTYTADGLISLGNMGGTFGHLYYRDGYLINRASSGGSPGPIWLTVWQLNGSEINTIEELEFDKYIDKHGEPLVTGAESYADAVNIVEKYGMSIDYQTMDFDGQSYCQVEIDTSALKDVNSYEEADFVSAVENYK